MIGPEYGITLPGATIVCGDSHTSTHGALASLAFGVGTSDVEHVLATQCINVKKEKNFRIRSIYIWILLIKMQHTICSVILARLGSSRLPHKAIKRFGDKTVLDFILNRARNLDNWPNIILATTDLDEDDELEKIAASHNIRTYRGSVEDVAGRFIGAANIQGAKWINRVNGDNVFFDYEKINYASRLIKKMPEIDLISNPSAAKAPEKNGAYADENQIDFARPGFAPILAITRSALSVSK